LDYGITEQTDVGIISLRPIGDLRRTDVPNPDQRTIRKPDTGVAGFQFQMDMIVNEKITNSKSPAKLFVMYLEANVVRGIFGQGRIGVRFDKFQSGSFDVTPNNIQGCKIVHVEVDDQLSWGGYLPMSAIIEVVGNPTTVIAALKSFIG